MAAAARKNERTADSQGNGPSKAKLQKESLQAELRQAKAQLVGTVFINLPFLAYAYLSNCTIDMSQVLVVTNNALCWRWGIQTHCVLGLCGSTSAAFYLDILASLDCDVNSQFAEVLLGCCSSS